MADTEIVKVRPTYDKLKKRGISTLSFCRMLEEVGVDISKRTLQHHLDNEFKTTTDDRLKKVAKAMINNHDNLVNKLKKEIK